MAASAHLLRGWLYGLARRCFWALPGALRNRLHDVRHVLVHWFRSQGASAVGGTGDLDWLEFRDRVLREWNGRRIVIFEPTIDWNVTLFQRPHHMALALGRLGCLVLFKTLGDGVAGFRQVADNVWIARHAEVDRIPGAVRSFYSTSQLASADDMRSASTRGRVVYEYIDHLDASISGGGRSLRRLQDLQRAAFDGAADLIVSSARVLHEESVAKCGAQRCACIPNGVEVGHFRSPRHSSAAPPAELSAFRQEYRGVVGYYGAIAPWLWYEAIDEVCAALPDVGFVFIGPDYSGCVPRLPRRANALYLGAVDYASLPASAHLFDVCFIPFRPGAVARSTSPLKLYEYFALEKPAVVTSDLLECVAFPEVFAGADAGGLVAAIGRAFEVSASDSLRARMRSLADANSWNVRAHAYLQALEVHDAAVPVQDRTTVDSGAYIP